jgi:dephospho-CoA kinase
MRVVACFSGGIGSGKTTLASAVAERMGLKVASFGAFVRQTAGSRGIAEEREALQALGETLIAEMTFDGFCRAVLEAAGWNGAGSLVVEGIRHVAAFERIKRLVAPVPAKLFFVDVPRDVRQVRADGARPDQHADLAKADAHSTEKDVHGALREIADLVLDGRRDLDALSEEIVGSLRAGG